MAKFIAGFARWMHRRRAPNGSVWRLLRSERISLATERKQLPLAQVVDIELRENVILGDEATPVECTDESQSGFVQRHGNAGDPAEFNQRYDTERNVFGHISMY
jgi:hypothetical protein